MSHKLVVAGRGRAMLLTTSSLVASGWLAALGAAASLAPASALAADVSCGPDPSGAAVSVAVTETCSGAGDGVSYQNSAPGGGLEVDLNAVTTSKTGVSIDATSGSFNTTLKDVAVSTIASSGDGVTIKTAGGSATVDLTQGTGVNGALNGIFLNNSGSGSVTVVTGAGSSVQGGDGEGIRASSGSAAITITTKAGSNVGGAGSGADKGLGIEALSGSGNVVITAGGGVTGGVEAATQGAITVSTGGVISATQWRGIDTSAVNADTTINVYAGQVMSTGREAINAYASGKGNVFISTAQGSTVSTPAANSFGIWGASVGGLVDITVNGVVSDGGVGALTGSGGGGAYVYVSGVVTSHHNVGVAVTTLSGPVGVTVASGAVVNSSIGGGIVTASNGGGKTTVITSGSVTGATYGIYTYAHGGSTYIGVNGGSVTGAVDGIDVSSVGGGAVHISTLAGTVVAGGTGDGINVAADGPVTLVTNGAVIGDWAVRLSTKGKSSSLVDAEANVTGANGAITSTTSDGANSVIVGGTGTVIDGGAGGNPGVFVFSSGAGPVSISSQAGTLITSSGGNAVVGQAYSGGVGINLYGSVGTTTPFGGNGVVGQEQGPTGDLLIRTNDVKASTSAVVGINNGTGATRIATYGALAAGGDGVFASNNTFGSGPLSVTVNANVAAGLNGVDASSLSVSSPVNVYVFGGAAITAGNGFGIRALSTAPFGNAPVTVFMSGGTSVSAKGGDGVAAGTISNGIINVILQDANVTSAGGDAVKVTSTGSGIVSATIEAGSIVTTTTPGADFGVFVSGPGALAQVDNYGTIGDGGVFVQGRAVRLNNSGVVSNSAGAGVVAQAAGPIVLDNLAGGLIQGVGVAQGAVDASGAGVAFVTNSGTITTAQSGHTGLALTTSEPLNLDNMAGGLVDGRIRASDNVTFTNAGAWVSQGVSDFGTPGGAATNTLTNLGLIQVGLSGAAASASASVFAHLGALNNGSATTTGVVSMMNGLAGDQLTVSGPFNGAAEHSQLALDAFLGGPGSVADVLRLGAGSSGRTSILIHDTNPGVGAINKAGIVLVVGATSASNFVIDPRTPNYDARFGGIDHGFYLYQLEFNAGTEALTSRPGVRAAQGPSMLSAVQQIWYAAGLDPSQRPYMGDRLGFAADGSEPSRFWISASNWQPGPVNAERQDLWTQLPSSGAGLDGGQTSNRIYDSPAANGGPSLSIDAGYAQSTASIMSGVDLVRRREADTALVVGMASGYVQSDQVFRLGADAVRYDGAVAALYADYAQGDWRVDGNLRADALKANYLGQGSAARVAVSVFGAELTGSYRRSLSARWTLAPDAQMSLAETSMSDLRAFGGVMRFSGGRSARLGVGLKLEGDLGARDLSVKMVAGARVWDELAGDNAIAIENSDLTVTDHLGGLASDFSLKLDAAGRDQRASAFIEGAYRVRSHLDAAIVSTGVKVRW